MTKRLANPSNTAADPMRSAWVAANAGAGKTYTLANRVTRLLLSGTPPERILCLTYTKAAAAEMQARLFKQLGEWSMLPGRELEAKITAIGADLGGPEEMKRARRLFAQALETPGGIRILTIHAFCQSVLSRFPLEAGVPASFDVLDDQTARELMGQARTRVLERAHGDTAEAKALALLITEVSEMTLANILDAALGADRRKLERFLDSLNGDDLGDTIRRAHAADPVRGADEMMTAFCTGLDLVQVSTIAAWLETGGKTDRERAESLRVALGRAPGRTMYEMFRALFLTQEGKQRRDIATATISKQRPDLSAAYSKIRDDFVQIEEERRAAHVAAMTIAALTLAGAVREEYGRLKQARGALDYDDLIVKTHRLLQHSEAATWVLYKLDGGIEHVLIDEAQDTSPEQWGIVRALTAEFFAGEGVEASRNGKSVTRTVFAVGDEKQSIFSFQGADPAQFDRNRQLFRNAAANAGREFLEQPLIQSRRSAPQVLQFVDAVFKPDEARAGLTSDTAAIRHEAHRTQDSGRVELWASTPVADKTQPDPYTLPPVDVLGTDSPVVQLARSIAGQIKGWIGRVRLPGHADPVKAGDIMILLPRREPFGNAIIRELKHRRVPVAGADRIVLTEQIAVMDLIALGRFALQSGDDYTLAALLRSPFCDVSEKDLFELAHPRGKDQSLWQALQAHKDDRPSYAAAHTFLSEMRDKADFAPPFEFYAHALVRRSMRLKMLRRLGQEANDAIDEFLSLTFAYEAANTPSLDGFLHWIERGGAEVKRDMERGRDEVRVMTVHGAKGLEADIVILPDTTTEPDLQPARGSLLYTDTGVLYPIARAYAPRAVEDAKAVVKARMMEEHRRLLYVALTRARDKLIVCGFENRRGVQRQSWYALAQQAAKELGMAIDPADETVRIIGADHEDILGAPKSEQIALAFPPGKPWLNKPAPRDIPAPRIVRPFDAAGTDEPATLSPFADNVRFKRGLLVHALLAHLPDIDPLQRPVQAAKFLRAQNVPDSDAAALVRETLAVIDDPQFGAAFAPGSRAEVAIVADLAELAPNAR
ncbi:MAG: double-strand break repair helicase AddA, partial [Alphaproteobacteria bacterium]|nr:double-strand break repair helicase AddA [Alphaproteobacteria bacterium]